MKRVGGHVTWLLEFDGPRADLAACGNKRTTMRRCHIVEAGDTLRLARADTGAVFAEVTVTRARQIEIGVTEKDGRLLAFAELDGEGLSAEEFGALAVADGFSGGDELVRWLYKNGKVFAGLYVGQLIEW